MRASWTRDEIILGLDVLISKNYQRSNKTSPEMIELSELLNRLPIVPKSNIYDVFRNPIGVSSMLNNFWTGLKNPNQKFKVGELFYSVYNEFKDNIEEIHKIAQAIRKYEELLQSMPFGGTMETEGFPEGAILSHVHRNIEAQYNEKCRDTLTVCEICSLHPDGIYTGTGGNSILSKHLLIAPADFDPATKLAPIDFVTVCPNCHRALHIIRPWQGREDCENILAI